MLTRRQLTNETVRNYHYAEQGYLFWCHNKGVRYPGRLRDVARYLRWVARRRSESTVRVHMAAIGRMYREHGLHFDTRAPEFSKLFSTQQKSPAAPKSRGAREWVRQ